MSLPHVAALMPTYGRAARQPHLIREAVADFLAQDYAGPKTLIVLNDADGHVLRCAHPNVWCVNMAVRATSLGTKCNIMTALARRRGAVFGMPWEDDDRNLPHRMTASVEKLQDLGGCDYWNPMMVWFHQRESNPVLDGKGVMHHASAFRLDAMFGRYEDTSRGHDAAADSWAKANLKCHPYRIPEARPEEVFYFYRWGNSDFHLSGQPDMTAAYASANPGPAGEYDITPTGQERPAAEALT